MNIVCERETLLNAVSNIQRAVSVKNLSPVTEGILLRAAGDALFLSAYDTDLLAMTTEVEATVKTAGQVVLSAKLFVEIVRKMSDELISIEVEQNLNTRICSGMAEFSIMGLPAEEFPEIPRIQEASTLSMPQPVLKSMIRQTIFAVAADSPQPVYTGTKFEIDGGVIRLIAMDGARLALRQEPIAELGQFDFIVPRKALQELLKLLSDEEDNTVTMTVGHRHIIFEVGDYRVITRLLEGEFMAYQRSFDFETTTAVRINSRRLCDAAERAALVVNDRIKSPLICHFHSDFVQVTCSTPLGTVNDKLPAVTEGADDTRGFNSRFLLDALKNCETDEVRIEMGTTRATVKIQPTDGDAFLFLVMPMRLN